MNIPNDNEPKKIIQFSGKDGKGVLHFGRKLYIGTVNIFIPPLAHFHTGRYHGKKRHYVLDTILALLIFTLLASVIVFHVQIRRFFVDDITLTIEASSPLTSGEAQRFTLTATNQTKTILTDIHLRLQLDDRFILEENAILETRQEELHPKEELRWEFSATPLAPIDETLSIKNFASYTDQTDERRANFILIEPKIETSLFSLTLDAPQSISPHESIPLTIDASAPEQYAQSFVNGSISDALKLLPSTPILSGTRWPVGDLSPRATLTLLRRTPDDQNVTIDLYTIADEREILVARTDRALHTFPPMTSSTIQGLEESLLYGTARDASITVTNTHTAPLKNVSVFCSFNNHDALTLTSSTAVSLQNGYAFTKSTLPELLQLEPGTSVTLPLTLTALSPSTAEAQTILTCTVSAETERGGETIHTTITGLRTEVTSVAPVILSSYALYTNVGAGPIPPRVGIPTLYRLYLEVHDTRHTAQSLTITALLPEDVIFAGNPASLAGGAPEYNEATRIITWIIPSFPGEVTTASASVDVQLLPAPEARGTIPTLLNPATLTYTLADGTTITATSPSVTAELTRDGGITGQGTITE